MAVGRFCYKGKVAVGSSSKQALLHKTGFLRSKICLLLLPTATFPFIMAESSQFATALVNETVNTFSGGAETVSPTDGISLIGNWISALHPGDESTNPMAHTLNELRVQLQNDPADSGQIQSLLEELTAQTREAAKSVEGGEQMSLIELSDSLKAFGERLSGKQSGDGSAPATAGPGVGASSANANSDQYGASGAAQQDGGSYGSGYGTK